MRICHFEETTPLNTNLEHFCSQILPLFKILKRKSEKQHFFMKTGTLTPNHDFFANHVHPQKKNTLCFFVFVFVSLCFCGCTCAHIANLSGPPGTSCHSQCSSCYSNYGKVHNWTSYHVLFILDFVKMGRTSKSLNMMYYYVMWDVERRNQQQNAFKNVYMVNFYRQYVAKYSSDKSDSLFSCKWPLTLMCCIYIKEIPFNLILF